MPLVFLPVWLGVGVACGLLGWKTQAEGWYAVAFGWFVLVGPICWLMFGAAVSRP